MVGGNCTRGAFVAFALLLTLVGATSAGAVPADNPDVSADLVADAPTGVSLASRTATSLRVRWDAPAANGGSAITDYVIEHSVAGSGTWTTYADGVSDATSATIRDLTPNVNYLVRVSAVNADGTGTASSTALSAASIIPGGTGTCVLLADATARCWGATGLGLLGDGLVTQSGYQGVSPSGLSGVSAITLGNAHACALVSGGTVRCWGNGANGKLGVGTGSTGDRSVPMALTGLSGVTQVVATTHSTCALASGAVYCWGHAGNGRLGNGTTTPDVTVAGSTQVQLSGGGMLTDATSIALGEGFGCAIRSGGTIVCWGQGTSGQLGNAASADQSSAVTVSGITATQDPRQLALGTSHACVHLGDGTVRCWGLGTTGQIGDGTNTTRTSPTAISSASLSGVTQIAAGSNTTCALLGGGTVKCWGEGSSGQIGDNATSNRNVPTTVASLTTATAITGRYGVFCASTPTGSRCWGPGSDGRLGTGTTANATQPGLVSQVLTTPQLPDQPQNPIARATSATSVRLSWSPGPNRGAAITDYIASYSGDGGATWTTFADGTSRTPVINVTGLTSGTVYGFRVSAVNANGTSWPAVVSPTATGMASVAAGEQFACAVTVDRSVACWGQNSSGQFGNGGTATATEPVLGDAPASGATAVTAGTGLVCFLTATGGARCAGVGTSGQLGNGGTANSTRFVAVSGLTGATRLVAGAAHVCAILADQTLSCWGANGNSQLTGTGNKTTPTAVTGITGAVDLALGDNHTCALLSGGTVRCWGLASAADPTLGNGTTATSSTPVTVETSAGVALSDVTKIAARYRTTCALKSDGTVWCWGRGAEGQIGNNSTSAQTRPVQVTGVTGATDVAVGSTSTCAVLASGRMKCWGSNDYGQVGDGSSSQRLTAVDVTGITNAVGVTAGERSICTVLQTRTVSCWGRADAGQLGDGWTRTSSLAPVAVRAISASTAAPLRPSAPSGVTLAGRTGTTIDITWTAPEYDGGSAITDYVIEYAVTGSTTWTTFADGTSADRRATITGLFPNVEYNVRVSAVNASGRSDAKPMQQAASRVVLGGEHGCALLVAGTVSCWGRNSEGQVGNGTTVLTPRAQAVTGLSGVTQIAAGQYHSCAVLGTAQSRAVRCWGYNASGQLGNNSTAQSAVPVAVQTLTDVVEISSQNDSTCARKADGTVWCWGANGNGQIGDGTLTNRPTPTQVPGITDAVSVSSGLYHTCAALASGAVKCWGYNASGQLGNGTTTQSTAPVTVLGVSSATAVGVGSNHTCALLADSTVACWGSNGSGQLGDGTTTTRQYRSIVPGIETATQIMVGSDHTCALAQGGTVLCWGLGSSGQLGEGLAVNRSSPVVAAVDVAFSSLGGGRNGTCAAIDGASQMCWGANTTYRLGDATTTNRLLPVNVVKTTLLPLRPDPPLMPTAERRNATTIDIAWNPADNRGSAITDYRVEYTTDGGATWATLNDGVSTTPRATLTGATASAHSFRVSAISANGPSLPADTSGAVQVAAGELHTCAVLADGGAACWGHSANGRLGTLYNEDRRQPTTIERVERATQIDVEYAHACARIADGSVRCWGLGGNGQLGAGSNADSAGAVAVTGISDATQVATGRLHSCALVTGGAVKCWGHNGNGQLGDGTTTSANTPVTVSGLTGATQIAAGDSFTCALMGDATVKCWGLQTTGRLGNNLTAAVNVLVPTTVLTGGSTSLTGVSSLAASYQTACAAKSDGTAWCWGLGTGNQIGDNGSANRAVATQVATIANAVEVRPSFDSACARLADGTMRCWGTGTTGQLGDGGNTNNGVPVTVSGIAGATSFGGSGQFWCAVVPDGVRCWGYNVYGQLGDGTTSNRTTPVVAHGIQRQLGASMPPSAPQNLIITASQGTSVSLQWNVPAYDGGSPVTDYVVEYSEAGTSRWYTVTRTPSTATTQTVTGLGPGLQYTFRVSAVNARGTGASASPLFTGVAAIATAAASSFNCALKTDQTVWCWGLGTSGQLGNGASLTTWYPVRVSGLTGATAVAVGQNHACALLADQSMWCWGAGSNGQLGQNSTTASNVPLQVKATASTMLAGVQSMALGHNTTCALLTTGAVRCWGNNGNGQVGNGGVVTPQRLPVEPTGLGSGVASITMGGDTACAMLAAGGARCWGFNTSGQAGTGTTANVTTPTAVTTVSGFRTIQPGANFSCAVMNDGTVRCWGNNGNGQLGDATLTSRFTTAAPVQGLENVRSITAGNQLACALLADATARCWGLGTNGQLGEGYTVTRSMATPVKGLTGITGVTQNTTSACALVGGQVRCWGLNSSGQLGDGTVTQRPAPVSVVAATPVPDVGLRITGLTVAAQTGTSVLLQWDPVSGSGAPLTGYEVAYTADNGATWTIVPTGSSTSPSVEISGLAVGQTYAFRVRARTANGLGRAGYLAGAAAVTNGNQTTCAVLSTGDVQCWGLNTSGQLGDGTTAVRYLPTTPYELGRVAQLSTPNQFACALLIGGTVKCMGLGTSGQLGDGAITSTKYPVTVNLPGPATALAKGYSNHMCAILAADGAVWCWGQGTSGQLGDGSSVNRSTPVRASTFTNVRSVTVGNAHTCVVLQDRTIRCWGAGTSGQLGNSAVLSSITPVTVTGISTAEEVVAGSNFTCARLTDGTVRCWGANNVGQLADGTFTNPRNAPTGGNGVTGATALSVGASHACALVAAGAIRCWGLNTSAQLGDNSTSNRTTAVAPSGALTGAVSIAAGSVNSCAAFAAGIVRCWGAQSSGQVGDNTTTTRTTPTQTLEIEPTFTTALTAPGAVRSVAVSARAGSSVSLQWLAPLRNGGSAVTDYKVEHSGDGVTWTVFADGVSAVPAATITGLSTSTSYLFRVSAINAVGTGPTELVALGGTQIAVGSQHACAISATGAVNCWGLGTSGELGWNMLSSSSVPVKAIGVSGATGIAAGGQYTCVTLATGGISCWGRGDNGQLGDGTNNYAMRAVSVSGIATARQVSAGNATTCARLGDGTVRCWGLGTSGQLGNGATASATTPQPVSGLIGATAIASGDNFTCAIRSPGQVWCWGVNTQGQLGDGTTTNRSTPVRAGTISTAVGIAAGGQTTCATLADRSVWCWGLNGNYQLANGTTVASRTPVRVQALDGVTGVTIGGDFVCAVLAGNAGTCWGANTLGQLGVNDLVQRQVPAVVFGEARYTQVDGGTSFACGVATDATIRCWGDASNGKLGDGSTAARLRPAAVALVTRTPTAPGAPTDLVATGGNQRVRLAWTAPLSDGDSPLTGYRAYVTNDPTKFCTTTIGASASSTSCSVTGLTNGTAYTFGVKAINALGSSVESNVVSGTPTGTAPTGTDDVANAAEAGGVGNGTAGADAMGNVLVNDLAPDQTIGGVSTEVTAVRTGPDGGSGLVGVIGVPLAGRYGSLTISANGDYTYSVDNPSPLVDALRAGEVARDYFNYTVSYGGPTDVGMIEVVITGGNDAPQASDDDAAATESGGTANDVPGTDVEGDVLANDRDADAGASMSIASVRLGAVEGSGTAGTIGAAFAGQYGTLTLRASGTYTYVVDNRNAAVEALTTGQSLTERFNYTVTDGAATDTGVLAISIGGAADAPTLAVSGSIGYTEQASARLLNPTIALGDVDSTTLASATITISADDVPGDQLLFTSAPLTMGNIAGTWDATAKALTLRSVGATATLAQWRSALAAVQFQNATSDSPGTSRTISWSISDGALASPTSTTSIVVTPVNDAPTLQALSLTIPENQVVTFDQSNFTGRYADAEGTAMTGITVTTLPAAGVLAVSGLPVEEGQFVTTDSIDNMTYTPRAQDAATRTFTVTASDGGRASAPATVTLAFAFVDDPPTTSDAAVSTLVSTPALLGVDAFGAYADPEGNALAGVVITALPARGALERQGSDLAWSAVTAGQAISAAELDAGRLRYTPTGSESGQPYTTFSFRVSDGSVLSRFANTMTVTVTAVNIAPTLSVPAVQTTAEDVAVAFSAANGNAISVDDADSAAVSVRISIPAGRGELTVASVASAYVGGNNTSQILLTGPPAEVNVALGTLRYTPTANANGTGYATLSLTADDRFATSTAAVVVDVTAVDDPPTFSTVSTLAGGTEDTAYPIAYADLLAASNAVDPEGDPIAFRIGTVTSGTLTKGGTPVVAGTTTLAAGESLSWTPAANANGTLDAFTVAAGGGSAWSPAVRVRVAVLAVDDAPTSTDDTATTDEDAPLSIGLADFGSYADAEGAPLNRVRITSAPAAGALQRLQAGTWTDVAANDIVTAVDIDAGLLRFAPAADGNGAPYATIGFRVGDASQFSATAYALAITVNPVVDPPAVPAVTTATIVDTSSYNTFANVTGSIVATSPDGAVTPRFGISGDTSDADVQTATGTFGTLSITAATGAYVYIPNRDAINRLAASASDVFRVTATADGGGTTTATVTVPITAVAEAITVRPATLTKGYGDPDPAFTYVVTSGTLVGDDSFSGTMTRVAGEAVGSYQINRGSLAIGSAYDVTFVPRSLTITNRRLTVTVADASKVYGGADPAPQFAITSGSLLEGDALTGTPSRATGETAGTYAYSLGTLSAGANYTLSVAGSLTITRAPLTVTGAAVTTRDFDGTQDAQITGASLSGVVGSDDVALASHTTGTFAQSAAGSSIPVTTAMTLTGTTAGNYSLTQPTLTGTINASSRQGRTLALAGTPSGLAASYAFDAAAPTVLATPSAGDGDITYLSSTPTVCTIGSSTGAVAFTGAGTCSVSATVAATPTYVGALAAPVSFEVTPIAPGSPTVTSITAYAEQLQVAFTLGASGGAAPTGIEYSLDGGAWTAFTPAATGSPVTISGLQNGTAYAVRLRVVSPGGTSGASNSFSGTPAPRTIALTTSLRSSYVYTETPPTVTAAPSVAGGEITYATTTPTTCLVDDSSGAVSFVQTGTCAVTATVSESGLLNEATATPRSFVIDPVAPEAPTVTSIVAGAGKLTVSFLQSASGGATPTNVEYSTDNGTSWTALSPASTASPLVITGLANGTTYNVRLRMVGPGGTSASSNMLSGTPTGTRTIAITSSLASSYLFSAAPPTLVGTPSEAGGDITYASSTASVCTVHPVGGKVTFVAAGTCTVTASVAASGGLNAATSSPRTFTVQVVAPSAPTITSLLPNDRQLTVEFALGSTGGADPSNVEYSTNGGTSWTARSPASVASPLVISGLTNGTSYDVQVRVIGPGGNGAASNTVTETPNAAVVRTMSNTGGSATYSFSDLPPTILGTPSVGGGTVTYASSTTGVCTVDTSTGDVAFVSAGTCSLTSSVTQSGIYLAATSPATTFTITAVAPSAPTITSITAGDQQLSVAFTAGSNGGAAATNVRYSTNGGTSWTTRSPASTASPLVITGLANGTTYDVQLLLVNSVGDGAASATTQAAPLAPAVRTLSLSGVGAATYAFDATPPTLVATPSEGGGDITFSSSTTPVCTVGASSGVVAFVTAGTCTVSAAVAAAPGYEAASATPVSFEVTAAAPGAPTISSITGGDGQVSVAFALGSTGGATPTNVEYSTDNGGSWTSRSPSSITSPLVITGLVNGTSYQVRLRIVGPGGTGVASAATAGAPVDPNARTISFTSSVASSYAFDGTPPTLVATPSTGAGTITYASSTPTVCTVDASSGQVAFVAAGTCTVTATVGTDGALLGATSAPSSFSVTAVAPGAPTITTLTPASGSLIATFALGTSGGATPTTIEYSTDDGASWTARSPASTASPITISGLTPGTTYPVRLRVVGPGGTGAPSAAVSAAPYGAPLAPTGVTAEASNGAATVRWTAPASDNGMAITEYVVTAAPGGATCLWTSGPLECTLVTLTNGTAYTFTVRARNAAGLGVASLPSAPVTPAGAAPAPTPAPPSTVTPAPEPAPPVAAGPVEVPGEPPAVREDGSAVVSVQCGGATACPTTIAFVVGGATVASKKQTLPGGADADLTLSLPDAIQDRLAQKGTLRVTIVVIVETADGPVRAERVMVLEAPTAEAASNWVMVPMANGDTSVSATCVGERVTHCSGAITFLLKPSSRAGTVVARARITGQGGQPMNVVVPLNARGRAILRERGSLDVDRVISMPGMEVRGKVAIAGGSTRIARIGDREWLIRTLDALMKGSAGRAALERAIVECNTGLISPRMAHAIMRSQVIPARQRTLERVRQLPKPSKELRRAAAMLDVAMQRSIENDRVYLRAFRTDSTPDWTAAWTARVEAIAWKWQLIREFDRIGARVGVTVPHELGVWP